MYLGSHLDGKMALSDKEKPYIHSYHLQLTGLSTRNSKTTSNRSDEALTLLLHSHNSKHLDKADKNDNPELKQQIKLLSGMKLDSPRELKRIVYQ